MVTHSNLIATIAAAWSATAAIFWSLPNPIELYRKARLAQKGAQLMLNLNIAEIIADVELGLTEMAKVVAIVETLNEASGQLTDEAKAAKIADLLKAGVDSLPIPASIKPLLENPQLDQFVAEGLVLAVKAAKGQAPAAAPAPEASPANPQ